MISTMERKSLVRLTLSLLLLPVLAVGCLHRQLEFTARRTLNTLPDLQYQQVMDNLAAAVSNPGRLPYLAVVGQGAIQVTDNGTTTLGLSHPLKSSAPGVLGLGGSRNVTGTWSLGTITSPDKIREMQLLYHRAVTLSRQGHSDYRWLNVGARRDVPRGARHAGHHGEVSAWVMPEGISGLSELTLAILDIATREDNSPTSDSSKSSPHQGPIPRRNFQVPASGPVFTPGVG
jgi:hypothetical protein